MLEDAMVRIVNLPVSCSSQWYILTKTERDTIDVPNTTNSQYSTDISTTHPDCAIDKKYITIYLKAQ